MSSKGVADPPPYVIPVEGKTDDVRVYHVHTPFTGPGHPSDDSVIGSSAAGPTFASAEGRNKFVSYETELRRDPGMVTCTSCQQQVMTNVTYKVGAYAWLMCILFILCGLVIGCCLIPFFLKFFKDAYHTCPRCNQIIHIDKKRCCS